MLQALIIFALSYLFSVHLRESFFAILMHGIEDGLSPEGLMCNMDANLVPRYMLLGKAKPSEAVRRRLARIQAHAERLQWQLAESVHSKCQSLTEQDRTLLSL